MAIHVVADTHAVLWYLYNDSRLSAMAINVMDVADQAGDQIAIASVTLAEVAYLVEKGRIHALSFERVVTALEQVNATLVEIPFDRTTARAMRQIDRNQVPDLPDRIVAATALHLGVPVVSRDRKIRSSIVTTIW
ncbi:MAG: type II toxin-antitoxin system VapC family toxin [Candidatus Promineifilaceae bacterium]|jgi:PIN domain nuclease of toxin-antitoxin system